MARETFQDSVMAETQAQAGWQQAGSGPGDPGFIAAEPPMPAQPSQPAPGPPQSAQPLPEAPPSTPSPSYANQFMQAAQPAAPPEPGHGVASRPPTGAIHHIELWVPNLDRAIVSWGWLLTTLGYRMFQDWPGGRSWQSGHAYIVVEQSPARTASRHDRCRPGLNHLAFHVNGRELVDELTGEALLHGWRLMFPDEHPFAGGPQHYAAYLENGDGFEAELVAD
jgi:catechol 2,3-dioxygenase-like lactoylglutathione lyase family enzyme